MEKGMHIWYDSWLLDKPLLLYPIHYFIELVSDAIVDPLLIAIPTHLSYLSRDAIPATSLLEVPPSTIAHKGL